MFHDLPAYNIIVCAHRRSECSCENVPQSSASGSSVVHQDHHRHDKATETLANTWE